MPMFEMLRVQVSNRNKKKARESNNVENVSLTILNIFFFYCRTYNCLDIIIEMKATILEGGKYLQNT